MRQSTISNDPQGHHGWSNQYSMLDSALVGRQQGNSYPLRDAHDARSRVSPTRFLHPRDWMVGPDSASSARKAQWPPHDRGAASVCGLVKAARNGRAW
jgi:hypothetical protein